MKITINLSPSEVSGYKKYLKVVGEVQTPTKADLEREIRNIVSSVIHCEKEAVSDYIKAAEAKEEAKGLNSVSDSTENKCALCGSVNDLDSDHIRTAYLNKQGILESGYYKPRLTMDEKHKIKSLIGDGEFNICSNRTKCSERQKPSFFESWDNVIKKM